MWCWWVTSSPILYYHIPHLVFYSFTLSPIFTDEWYNAVNDFLTWFVISPPYFNRLTVFLYHSTLWFCNPCVTDSYIPIPLTIYQLHNDKNQLSNLKCIQKWTDNRRTKYQMRHHLSSLLETLTLCSHGSTYFNPFFWDTTSARQEIHI